MIDHLAAYSAFANGGTRVRPFGILQVRGADGTVLERKTPTKQSLPAGANPSTTGAPPIRVTPSLPGGKPAAPPQQTPAPAKK